MECWTGSKLNPRAYQPAAVLLELLSSTSFKIPLLFEKLADAMVRNLFKDGLINHVYHLVNEKAEVYDEEYSVRAVLDEAASATSSSETLLAKRGSVYHYSHRNGIIISLNIALFCLSITLFGISGHRLMKPDDPYDNSILRKSSEHCMWFVQGGIVGG